jgi:hypothetical protein
MVLASLVLGLAPAAAQTDPSSELEGLWVVERTYAPTLRGELVVTRQGGVWRASIGGQSAEASSPAFSFGNHGAFRGRVERSRPSPPQNAPLPPRHRNPSLSPSCSGATAPIAGAER